MRSGGGKAKGTSFERFICKILSSWVTAGERQDVFWRSAISGGRATSNFNKAKGTVVAGRYRRKQAGVRQAGDICAVSPEGAAFICEWFIECKHIRRISLESFLLFDLGPLAKFWKVAKKQARQHNRKPMIIIKQNRSPILVVTEIGELSHWATPQITSATRRCDISLFDDMLLTNYVRKA